MATTETFIDIAIEGNWVGRIVFELYEGICPMACENFRKLCTGEMGVGRAGQPLWYKGTPFTRIIPGFVMQGGDITHRNGKGGESLFNNGGAFRDENFKLKHDKPGVLAMASCGPGTNKSQFYIAFVRLPFLDGKSVCFGQVIQGFDILKLVASVGSEDGTPKRRVQVCDAGMYDPVFEMEGELRRKEAEAAMPQIFDDQLGIEPNQRTKVRNAKAEQTFDPLPFEAFESVHV